MIPQHGTLEISRSRLAHNAAVLRKFAGPAVMLSAAIKASCYGHGTSLLVPLLLENGVRWSCVYSLEEVSELLSFDWQGILVLAPLVLPRPVTGTTHHLLNRALSHGIVRITLADEMSARHLSAFASQHLKGSIPIHIQVDTGLTRLGIPPAHAETLAALVTQLPGLTLEGLYAHLSHGDVPGHDTLQQQFVLLDQLATKLRSAHPRLMVHLQNSGGTCNLDPEIAPGLSMVRLGIALYGLQPATQDPIPDLLPIARLTAPILAIHNVPANTGIGYGHTFVTTRPSRIAIVPVGYAEGYPRHLSNRGTVQLHNQNVPLIGRVSMDQIILDVTDFPSVHLGDTVTVISNNPTDPNSLDQMATTLGTIGYELATHLGPRLRRIVVD